MVPYHAETEAVAGGSNCMCTIRGSSWGELGLNVRMLCCDLCVYFADTTHHPYNHMLGQRSIDAQFDSESDHNPSPVLYSHKIACSLHVGLNPGIVCNAIGTLRFR